MSSLAPVAQWIEYLTSNQSVARSSRAEGIFFSYFLLPPFVIYFCAAFEPPGRG